ncbi:hypothetical protein TRVA0_006S02410 [Trichomonascus vanleenenianus]|uniref:uncharacterized protein n=1 Tax=Trichomonascus vanleenenianus TaxID=2268995 RepID=UPI003ECB8AD0
MPPTGPDMAFCDAVAARNVPITFLRVSPTVDRNGYACLPFEYLAQTKTQFTFHYYPDNGPVIMRGPQFHSHVSRLVLSNPAVSTGTIRLNTYVQSFTRLKVAELKFIVNGTAEDLHINFPPTVETLKLILFDQDITLRPLWVSGYGVTKLTIYTTSMLTMSPESVLPVLEDLNIVLARAAEISYKLLSEAKTWILAFREKSQCFNKAELKCDSCSDFILSLSCRQSTLELRTLSSELFVLAVRCFLLPQTGFSPFMFVRYRLGLLFHWHSEDLLYFSQRLYMSNNRLNSVQFVFHNNERSNFRFQIPILHYYVSVSGCLQTLLGLAFLWLCNVEQCLRLGV